jgi:hypothetical protein
MSHFVNSTGNYHISELDSLGWELTICNALQPETSPCRRVLENPGSYGSLLFDFLSARIAMERVTRVVEVGGGYGYLMRDFLRKHPGIEATMVDISPYLLDRQKETIGTGRAEYILKDFFSLEAGFFRAFHVAILNENAGDFPTVCEIPADFMEPSGGCIDASLESVRRLFLAYRLEKPEAPRFNFNLGAAEAVEKLCLAGIPCIFLGEHSCEAPAPGEFARLSSVRPSGNPERIRLRGHDEYTIRFSHLQKIAETLGYETRRGSYADMLKADVAGEFRFIMNSEVSRTDEHEVIRQFIEDLYKYEYLVLLKGGHKNRLFCKTRQKRR